VSELVGWFVGRRDELAVVASAAVQVRSGRAWVVWVEGEAGTGKSMLMRRALADLGDFTVVVAEADELAVDMPFGVVDQLLQIGSAAPFPVGLELLTWFAGLQDRGPVALVIEDLHWADAASRLALLTAVRRLHDDHVLVLVTARSQTRGADDGWLRLRSDPSRCRHVVLGALSVEDVADMAVAVGAQLARRDSERLHRHTAGHPLYLRTLLTELTPGELSAPDGALPVPRSLASATVGRLAELPPPARDLAAALAVWNQRVPLATLGSLAGIAAPAAALEELLATGFVTWVPGEPGTPVAFAHPLYRAAVYADLAPTRRRRLHLAAAGLADPDAALVHRVSAADRPDAALAAELEAAAREARDQQMHALSARYLSWASDLSPAPALRERRLLEAARAILTDDRADAEALRPRLERCADSRLRDLTLGKIAWRHGDPARAEQLLRAAAAGPAAPDVAAEALVDLAGQYAMQSRGQDALAAATAALELPELDAGRGRIALAMRAVGIAQLHGAPRGLDTLSPHMPAPAGHVLPTDANLLLIRGMLAHYAGRASQAAEDLRAVIALARRGAIPRDLPRAHLHLAQSLFVLGDWDEALVNARVALSLIAEEGQHWLAAQAHAAAMLVPAARGEWQVADGHLSASRDAAQQTGTPEARYAPALAAAALHRARAEHQGVVEALSPLTGGNDGRAIPPFTTLHWWHTLIGSLIETGDLTTAAEQTGHFEAAAAARSLDLSSRVADLRGRLAAARGQPAAAAAAFEQAIAPTGVALPLLDRADVRHHYGRLLHARGDRQGAIIQLRAARELLQPAAARPYLERIDADLAACGISPGPRGGLPLGLTDREQDVVTLVAKGLSNREVAAALYVSPKAVEYHLGNVFAKLGITSRRQLRDAGPAHPGGRAGHWSA
jgi:ATP/maltotriose-dependent transcriptional regulator MalT